MTYKFQRVTKEEHTMEVRETDLFYLAGEMADVIDCWINKRYNIAPDTIPADIKEDILREVSDYVINNNLEWE